MRATADRRFVEESERFALRYTCDDCVHAMARRRAHVSACSLGYPDEDHRPAKKVVPGDPLVFCKHFDLGG